MPPTRVNFVYAPDPFHSAHQNFGNQYMPIWAFVLASHVDERAGFALDLFDTRIVGPESITSADVFVFSGMNQDYRYMTEVAAELRARNPDAVFLVGGPICWSYDKAGTLDRLAMFDHAVVGDGEDVIGRLLEAIASGQRLPKVIRVSERFDLARSRPMHSGLMRKYVGHYYGGVVEVSRGCPFLCEFCDIRIMKDNNRAHNKAPDKIVADVDALSQLGVDIFMFACDNFIGDSTWAHAVVDGLLEWKGRSGKRPSIFTWLTINLYKDEALMAKMRRAGFDMLFIGVESFDANSLLETAKVQNRTKEDLPEILRRIQAYGFVVTPGLIFGFDSDSPALFDVAIAGLERSCLLTSNPSLLIALPGTPLYRRMSLAGRLREGDQHIGRFKFQSNMRYLLPRDLLVNGYIDFVRRVSDGRHQYRRFRSYVDNLLQGDRYIPLPSGGYGNLAEYLRSMLRNPVARRHFLRRLGAFAADPRNVLHAFRGLALVLRRRRHVPDGMRLFLIWMYGWTNFVVQHWRIRPEDFDVESAPRPLRPEQVLPPTYETDVAEDIPPAKTRAQLRNTVLQLRRVAAQL
jgi:radical SAM superfamily enzyme YgiQ (UPF0313 family)